MMLRNVGVLFLFFSLTTRGFGGDIVINEIMYHPSSENSAEEYIELFNKSTNVVELQGWHFSRGVDFTFTNATAMVPGAYLVVAADVSAFTNKYPNVTNVLGGWVGRLSNRHEDIELENGMGDREDLVAYAEEGDWAVRRQVSFGGVLGWVWFAEHDGLGKSAELRNTALPNDTGQNWQASIPEQGTPGRANSASTNNIAPMILEVNHFPAVPRSTDPVTVTARIVDEVATGLTVTLFYRNAHVTPLPAFSPVPMQDNGLSNDGAAGDGIYGAILPPNSAGTVVDFYVRAIDTAGLARTWPAPALDAGQIPGQFANALYQVDESTYPGTQQLLRLILTEPDRATLASAAIRQTDAQMNTTCVSTDGVETKIRYNVGVRIRGAGSRGTGNPVPNYRVNFPNDKVWNGVESINLGSRFTHAQLVGGTLATKSGLQGANVRAVQVRVNGQNLAQSGAPQYGAYVLLEVLDSDWAQNHFPEDGNGNIYRGSRYPWTANLDYTNTFIPAATPQYYSNAGYSKTSNQSENDWTDLFQLTYALSPNTLDANYVQTVRANANVEMFLRYFAVCNLLEYSETSLCIGIGDDYALYRGVQDPRFRIVPHDFDTILGQGDGDFNSDESIWVMIDRPPSGDPTQRANFLSRFMRHPEFAPIYFGELKRLCDTTFSSAQLDPMIDQLLSEFVPPGIGQNMKDFAAERVASVLSQIPQRLTISTNLPISSGFPRTTLPTVDLNGQANAIDTRYIQVNGEAAQWIAWQGTWSVSGMPLVPGINRILVQSLDANARELERAFIDIWYDDGSVVTVSGQLPGSTIWAAAAGPFVVSNNVTVLAGQTLTIQPGATVFFTPGSSLTVQGRLVLEGNEIQRVRLTRAPGTGGGWAGLQFSNSNQSNRLVYADLEFASAGDPITLVNSTLFIDHVTWSGTTRTIIDLSNSSLVVQNSSFPTIANNETIHGVGMPANGYVVIATNYFGGTTGYSDIIDFTGGHRPGPILQVYANVFNGGSDDALDLDDTDAHIEGNVFLNIHQDGFRDSGSYAIATDTGADLTVVRNIFYNNDHALLLKNDARAAFHNNTVFHVRTNQFSSYPAAVIVFGEPDRDVGGGAGADLDGNIFWDVDGNRHFLYFTNDVMFLPVRNSLLSGTNHPGPGNLSVDPLFQDPDTNSITFASIREALSLRPGSPAQGAGPNGLDMGGLVAGGASISGEPAPITVATEATLTVSGPGITHYRYRLNDGPLGPETLATNNPIALTGLTNGSYTVRVVGKNSAGIWQPEVEATASQTWTVDGAFSRLVISEVLARNRTAVNIRGEFPDLIELHNQGAVPIDLDGMGLTDDPTDRFKYVFPPNTQLGAGEYLVLVADNETGPEIHLGFALNQEGEGVYLSTPGGAEIDSIVFGIQVADFSLGRLADGTWALTRPTLGAPNQVQGVTDPTRLKINEWLADGNALYPDDFVEVYNPDPVPAALGGLYLTDEPIGAPTRFEIAPLSFIGGQNHLAFLADNDPEQGNLHLNFRLGAEQGYLALLHTNLQWIDCIRYGPQSTGVSEGRQPDGADHFAFFGPATQSQPTPGAPNPSGGLSPSITNVVLNLLALTNVWSYEASGSDLGTEWRDPGYNDLGWQRGPGLLYYENLADNPLPFPNTLLPYVGQRTIYFRTAFVVETNLDEFNLSALTYLDDGAVLYLNGTEILRARMPMTGDITYGTLASSSPPSGDAALEVWNLPTAHLSVGTNVLAVEVHQQSAGSSDIVWGMALDASRTITNPPATAGTINEVLANNQSLTNADGSLSDWIELYNPLPNPVDLSGLSLTDTLDDPQRWVFPAGATVQANGYLLVQCDPNQAPTTNLTEFLNTGFGLNAQGDAVFLFDRPDRGGGLLDSIAFGLQIADFSIGRLPNGGVNWNLNLPTPGSANLPASLGLASALRINEWMADPASGDDWFELYNPNNQPVALGGFYVTDDLADRNKHQLAPLSFIGASTNGYLQLFADGNPQNGADHVNFALSRNGEALGLATPDGTPIDAIQFGPQREGVSEGRLPDAGPPNVAFEDTPSPGESNYLPLRNVLIHEVLTHSDLPLEDAIELRNFSAEDVPIGGWFLSDSQAPFRKFRIPDGTVLPAESYIVFYEYQFNPDPGFVTSFALSSARGDQLYLSEADPDGTMTGYRDVARFGAALNGVSFGRYETSTGYDVTAVSPRTFGVDIPPNVEAFRQGTGLPNAGPQVGPVVINEIMYHPPDIDGTNDNTLEEYIELQNVTAQPVLLYDPDHETNTWRLRDAVDYEFAPDTILDPGEFLLVVSFDPATNETALASFRATYLLSTNVPIVGPYRGRLGNDGESVEIKKPDGPTPDGFVPYVMVDEVNYRDTNPWPSIADNGSIAVSLQRRVGQGYGNDPVNWLAGAPTPGQPTGPALLAPPIISLHPASRSVPLGSTVTFQADGTGAFPLQFQWRFHGWDIPGATNTTYTVANAQVPQAGVYSVRVSNPVGAALSQRATLALELAPLITQQPLPRVVAPGVSTFFSVAAQGSRPLSYQWRFNGSDLPGENNPTLVIPSAQLSDEGAYSVVLSNQFGVTLSLSASLTLNDPPVIVDHPASLTVFAGRSAQFSVTATGSAPLGYQWRFNGLPLTGQTDATLTLSNVQTNNAGVYTVVVTNLVGIALSQPAVLEVVIPPKVTILASDPEAAEAGLDPGSFTFTRTGINTLPLSVDFLVSGSALNGSDYELISSPITIPSGANTATLVITPINDTLREPAETVEITVIDGAEYSAGSPATAMGIIEDDDNLAPFIEITSPLDGTVLPVTPTNVTLTVLASDPDGTVTKVEFFNHGTNALGQSVAAPFSLVWTNAPRGTNLLTARATDDLGRTELSSPVQLFVNFPPVIRLTSPSGSQSYLPGSDIPVAAEATDPDGTIVRVDFFAGTDPIGSRLEPPFEITLTNVPAGKYPISALAMDDRGVTVASPSVLLRVREPSSDFADMFEDRGEITGTLNYVTGNTVNATRELGEPEPFAYGDRTVWLTWRAPRNGLAVMQTIGSSFDTVVAVFTNSSPTFQTLSNLVLVAENDDSQGLQSQAFFMAVAGVDYHIRVEGYDAGESGALVFTQILISEQPMFLGHPVDQQVAEGSNTIFTATGAALRPFAGQWRRNGVDIPGANNLTMQTEQLPVSGGGTVLVYIGEATLTVTNVQPAVEGDYTLVLANSYGAETSQVARLSIVRPPTFVRQPADLTVVEGDTVTFRVEMNGTSPFGYRWFFGFRTIVPFELGQPALTLTNVQTTNAGRYSVVVTNLISPSGARSRFATLTVLADADGDHMPDTWESDNGFDPQNPADGAVDTDNDGMDTLAEFRAGTDPRNPASFLKVEEITSGPGSVALRFQAVAGKSYSVLRRDLLTTGPWEVLRHIGPETTNHTVLLSDPTGNRPQRFYQLVTPEQP